MKNLKRLPAALVATAYLLLYTFNTSAQNIGINATGADPDESALLDLSSEDKGFLITRVDTAKIVKPAFGLMTLSPLDSCLYMFNGKPKGRNWISLGGVGETCYPSSIEEPEFEDVLNPKTGKTWMDRNLGASQVATSHDDPLSFGDLYQWGRASDGHEKRNSGETSTTSATDTPGHSDRIMFSDDWRSPRNDNLWDGINGINNPCPTGYRLPTDVELSAELASWASKDADGAFGSPLKLPAAGVRVHTTTNTILNPGFSGYYWSGTTNSTLAKYLYLRKDPKANEIAGVKQTIRATGYSVRCIKD